MSQLLTQTEVAELLNCSTKSVARMARDKVIPAPIMLKGMKRWNAEALREWLRSQGEQQAAH